MSLIRYGSSLDTLQLLMLLLNIIGGGDKSVTSFLITFINVGLWPIFKISSLPQVIRYSQKGLRCEFSLFKVWNKCLRHGRRDVIELNNNYIKGLLCFKMYAYELQINKFMEMISSTLWYTCMYTFSIIIIFGLCKLSAIWSCLSAHATKA